MDDFRFGIPIIIILLILPVLQSFDPLVKTLTAIVILFLSGLLVKFLGNKASENNA